MWRRSFFLFERRNSRSLFLGAFQRSPPGMRANIFFVCSSNFIIKGVESKQVSFYHKIKRRFVKNSNNVQLIFWFQDMERLIVVTYFYYGVVSLLLPTFRSSKSYSIQVVVSIFDFLSFNINESLLTCSSWK